MNESPSNIPSIMMSSAPTESDAEDVNDFLRRIQELSQKRDQEDEERNRKLEEEIMQGRRERQARRAERARSISPVKGSPMNSPSTMQSPAAKLASPIAFSTLSLRPSSAYDEPPSNTKDESASVIDTGITRDALADSRENVKPVEEKDQKPLATPTRNSTLSWQQRRPLSQASNSSRSQASSVLKPDIVPTVQKTSQDLPPAQDEPILSRNEIAQSLAARDPAWFRQTADRDRGSAAFRKSQVEDVNVMAHGQLHHLTRMPGMSHKSSVDRTSNVDGGRSSPSVESSTSRLNASGDSGTRLVDSPPPVLSPKLHSHTDSESSPITKAAMMSPSQSRMSRPLSPTKGLGGFVQSAMMKRSDSVNKRWSVPSPTGLSRADSVMNNKSTLDSASVHGRVGSPIARGNNRSNLGEEVSPKPQSRPHSIQSGSSQVQDLERPKTSESTHSGMTSLSTDSNTNLPPPETAYTYRPEGHERVAGSLRARSRSPTKWSPTKSSWLESALSRPESPKPRAAQSPSQPSWMSEISKAKVRNAHDASPSLKSSQNGNTMEITETDPIRSLGDVSKPTGLSEIDTKSSRSRNGFPSGDASLSLKLGSGSPSSKVIESKERVALSTRKVSQGPPLPSTPKPLLALTSTNTRMYREVDIKSPSLLDKEPSKKLKPETPPKKDFRGNLKPRQPSPGTKNVETPEFKSLRGQLRGTKTQNYVAPDILKDNIMRGKADLIRTGGPKRTERRDDFKEAIVEKKEMYKKIQAEGKGVVRTPSSSSHGSPPPEALVRAKSVRRSDIDDALQRSRSASRGSQSSSPVPEALAKAALVRKTSTAAKPTTKISTTTDVETATTFQKPELRSTRAVSHAAHTPSLRQEASSPARLQNSKSTTGLAAKFNPALAGLLARGPPPALSPSHSLESPAAKSSETSHEREGTDTGPQLIHMTKARARGPKRKAPTAKAESSESASISISSTSATAPTPRSPLSASTISTKSTKPDPITVETTSSSTPRKLDMKRRSQFLAESPASSPIKESPKLRSSSPVKEASFAFEKLGDTPSKTFQSTASVSPRTPKTPFLSGGSPALSPRMGPGAPPKPRNLSGIPRSSN